MSMCDVKTSYVLCAMPYLGKENRSDDVGVAEQVVLTLMDPYRKTGLNVATNNPFTLMKTAKNLLKHDITMVRTLGTNKKEIPYYNLYYNSNKGGVNTANEMLCTYSTKAASRPWPLVSFLIF